MYINACEINLLPGRGRYGSSHASQIRRYTTTRMEHIRESICIKYVKHVPYQVRKRHPDLSHVETVPFRDSDMLHIWKLAPAYQYRIYQYISVYCKYPEISSYKHPRKQSLFAQWALYKLTERNWCHHWRKGNITESQNKRMYLKCLFLMISSYLAFIFLSQ